MANGLGPSQPLPRTLLPLARYAEIMQISAPHFHQMAGVKAPLGSGCDKVWDQDARNLLAWTMVQAEELIAVQLNTWPAPNFIVEEEVSFGLRRVRSDWRNAEVKTKWGQVEAWGTEKLTLHEADATVAYSNLDSDPLEREETAIIGTAIYGTLAACSRACDVAVFFRVEDGAEDDADPSWEIRPVKVDIDGTTMTIRAESSQFIRPDLWALTESECKGSGDKTAWIHSFDVSNLVSKVDVYCRTVDLQTPVTLLWDGICGCASQICEHNTQLACAYHTSKRQGSFAPRPATWSGTANIEATPTYRQPPESLLVSYRAGFPLDRFCRMNYNLERAIVKLTNVLLPEPPCGFCDAAQIRWKEDRTPIDPLTPEAAAMPWDLYAQGALEAWRIVKLLAMGRGGKMGR